MRVDPKIQQTGYDDLGKHIDKIVEVSVLVMLVSGRSVPIKNIVWNILKGWEKRVSEEILKIEESEVMGVGDPRSRES